MFQKIIQQILAIFLHDIMLFFVYKRELCVGKSSFKLLRESKQNLSMSWSVIYYHYQGLLSGGFLLAVHCSSVLKFLLFTLVWTLWNPVETTVCTRSQFLSSVILCSLFAFFLSGTRLLCSCEAPSQGTQKNYLSSSVINFYWAQK